MTEPKVLERGRDGRPIAWQCSQCSRAFTSGWGDLCNSCRAEERRHKELLQAITARRPAVVTQMAQSEPRIEIRETYMKPTIDWPEGGYLREVDGKVEIATGYFATIYPDKPSPYIGGKAPFVMMWE